jgi:hypothetical protein
MELSVAFLLRLGQGPRQHTEVEDQRQITAARCVLDSSRPMNDEAANILVHGDSANIDELSNALLQQE